MIEPSLAPHPIGPTGAVSAAHAKFVWKLPEVALGLPIIHVAEVYLFTAVRSWPILPLRDRRLRHSIGT